MTLKLVQPEYHGLEKIISGGQTGVDQGALEAAHVIGVSTGGVAPKGFITNQGPMPELARYGLVEDTFSTYDNRTRRNVADSDATLIIGANLFSPGSKLTASYCKQLLKPCVKVKVPFDYDENFVLQTGEELTDWVVEEQVKVLNVAGNRDAYRSTFHFRVAERLISCVLINLHMRSKLPTSNVQFNLSHLKESNDLGNTVPAASKKDPRCG